jgi:hypothetical protein
MLMARARCSGRTESATIGSATTPISAPAQPCRTRAATSVPIPGASATSALVTPKPPMASRNAGSGPARSTHLPAARLSATSGSE